MYQISKKKIRKHAFEVAGHSRSLETVPFDSSHMSLYSSSTIIIVIPCIVSEIKRDISRKSRFSYHLVDTNSLRKRLRAFSRCFLYNRVRWRGYNVTQECCGKIQLYE